MNAPKGPGQGRRWMVKGVLIVTILVLLTIPWWIHLQFSLDFNVQRSFAYYSDYLTSNKSRVLADLWESIELPRLSDLLDPATPQSVERDDVRLLCLVVTQPTSLSTKATAVNETWGRRCNYLYFISTQSNESELDLPVIHGPSKETYMNLWSKTKYGFKFAHEHFRDKVDWVLKADDDTYVIIENLKDMLRKENPEDPLYFGAHFGIVVAQGYNSGGSGYVMSRRAVELFATVGLKNGSVCREEEDGYEDVEMGVCMEKLGVKPGYTRDDQEEERFIPEHLNNMLLLNASWLNGYLKHTPKYGYRCCSKSAISFHYIAAEQMYIMEYLIYKLRVRDEVPQELPAIGANRNRTA